MKVYEEISLQDFEFWGGAVSNVKEFTEEELEQIQDILEMEYPQGMDETQLNDLFWFDSEAVRSWLDL